MDSATPAVEDPNSELGVIQQQKNTAIGERDQAMSQLQTDRDNFDPAGAAGPQPVFAEQTPQDHFGAIMGQAPLLMALGALGGKFGNAHGVAMLQTTNAMMTGMIKGNDQAYQKAREDYEQKYDQYKQQSKTWMDVYKAYSAAYKGRIDADQRAITGANAAVGLLQRDEASTKSNIAQRVKLDQALDKQHAQIMEWGRKDSIAQQNADAHTASSAASTTRAATGAAKEADKKSGNQDDSKEVLDLLDENISTMQNHNMVAGGGGQLREGKEYVAGMFDKNADMTATQFRANNELMKTKMTAYLKSKGKMGADERKILESAIDVVDKKMVNSPQGIAKLKAARDVIAKSVNNSRYTPGTVNGKAAYKDSTSGKMYYGTPPTE